MQIAKRYIYLFLVGYTCPYRSFMNTLNLRFFPVFNMLLLAHVTCIDKLQPGQNPGMYTERAEEFLP